MAYLNSSSDTANAYALSNIQASGGGTDRAYMIITDTKPAANVQLYASDRLWYLTNEGDYEVSSETKSFKVKSQKTEQKTTVGSTISDVTLTFAYNNSDMNALKTAKDNGKFIAYFNFNKDGTLDRGLYGKINKFKKSAPDEDNKTIEITLTISDDTLTALEPAQAGE